MISKESNVLKKHGVPTVLCRIIGEFAGCDLHLKPGQFFFDYTASGRTYVNLDGLTLFIGDNMNISKWLIKKRTPKSYVVEYDSTLVNCEVQTGRVYRFITTFEQLNGSRRIFPFRRSTVGIERPIFDTALLLVITDSSYVNTSRPGNVIISF